MTGGGSSQVQVDRAPVPGDGNTHHVQFSALLKKITTSRRARLALITNAISSVGNLAVSLAVARTGSVLDLGAFAVAFSVYALVAGLAQAAVTETVLASAPDRETLRNSARRVVSIGLFSSAGVILVGAVLRLPYLVIVGLALPGMLLYDYVKTISLGISQPGRAFAQETVWTTVTLVALWLGLSHALSAMAVFVVWAASGSVIGIVGAACVGYLVPPGWRVRSRETRLAVSFGLDFLAGTGSAQIATTLLAGMAGVAVVGALRAGGTALGPVTLLMGTARPLLIPFLARTKEAASGARVRAAVFSTAILLCAVIPLAGGVVVVPDVLGTAFLGDNWRAAQPLLAALAFELVFATATAVAFAGHRVQRAGMRTLLIRSVLAPLRVVGVVGAGMLFGAKGAATAMALMALIGLMVWWASYLSLVRTTGGSSNA
ncbi:MAG TPA: hypothetical protein VFO77_10635 [Actinoplanes sp.]|nr:hypothetical protein [Actinoplanes sp.]